MRTPCPATLRRAGAAPALALLGSAVLVACGCQSARAVPEHPPNPSLRHLEVPAGATGADADRAALARFVGVWNFSGWSTEPSGGHKAATGRAAGTIENENFVLIDVDAAAGVVGGHAGHKSGSMILGSEPGIGVTLTAWGDSSPSMSRFVGRAEGSGAVFTFVEARTPRDRRALSVVMTFETDDRWVAQVRDETADGKPVIAEYTFSRAKA